MEKTRKQVNGIVRNYAMAHGGNYKECYDLLYREFNKQNSCYIKARAKHNKADSIIDFIEKHFLLDSLLQIAIKLFK